MDRNEITRIAREAGFVVMDGDYGTLRRFANLVAAAEREAVETEYPVKFASVKAFEDWCASIRANEREACAKVCDELAARDKLSNYYKVAANAIRARGNQ